MRTIAIGDIHGCDAALEELIAAVDPAPDDRLVFLGDYIDRGPDSARVLDRLLDLAERCDAIYLQGNHDLLPGSWHRGELDRSLWAALGGEETLESYGGGPSPTIPELHLDFLANCRPYFETDTHMFVHANYCCGKPLAETDPQVLQWTHLSWPLPRPHCSGKVVVCGHTPQTDGRVADFGHLVCVDTYCFGGGALSAYDVDSRSVLQVNYRGRVIRDWTGLPSRSWLNEWMGRVFNRRCRPVSR